MAVSIDTVNDIVTRTLKALRGLRSNEALAVRVASVEGALVSYTATGRFVQPNANWLMCDLCRALGQAAELVRCCLLYTSRCV